VPRTSVVEGVALARQLRADCIVSLGGGSPIDCAKGVALGLAHEVVEPEDLARFRTRFVYPDTLHVPDLGDDLIPHIAVPTTLSGGEHTALCGITHEATREKELYRGAALQPRIVVLDPRVTVSTPAWLWTSSGMRAVDHAVEGILSKRHMALTDALGAAALGLLATNLVRAAQDPADEDGRLQCQIGAWLAIFGLSGVGSGLSHGVGHQLAAEFGMVHGVTSAIMLPHVMEFVRTAAAARMRPIAEAFGAPTHGLDDTTVAGLAVDAVRTFAAGLGVPTTISAAGGREDALPAIADRVMTDPAVSDCPRPVSHDDVRTLLRNAW
jgi:alcohol dehydrogenase class IV